MVSPDLSFSVPSICIISHNFCTLSLSFPPQRLLGAKPLCYIQSNHELSSASPSGTTRLPSDFYPMSS
ncbi:NAD/NADP-dependent indole-3-acetaldehyde reductase [Fusarium oxysporum f. sp. albedinis]|nr:NAD/NADP-dependent indole-3-acetaldehyde reductase [Fusarium oxysporum f. sp. albedinis]